MKSHFGDSWESLCIHMQFHQISSFAPMFPVFAHKNNQMTLLVSFFKESVKKIRTCELAVWISVICLYLYVYI